MLVLALRPRFAIRVTGIPCRPYFDKITYHLTLNPQAASSRWRNPHHHQLWKKENAELIHLFPSPCKGRKYCENTIVIIYHWNVRWSQLTPFHPLQHFRTLLSTVLVTSRTAGSNTSLRRKTERIVWKKKILKSNENGIKIKSKLLRGKHMQKNWLFFPRNRTLRSALFCDH